VIHHSQNAIQACFTEEITSDIQKWWTQVVTKLLLASSLIIARDTLPASANPQRFMRLSIQLLP